MYFCLPIRDWFKNCDIQLRISLSIINKIYNICKICCSKYNCKWNIKAGLLFLQLVIHWQNIDQYTYCRFDTKNRTVFTDCIHTLSTSLILTTFFLYRIHRMFLFQPTNAQIYITTLHLYIMFTLTCFYISVSYSGSFNNLRLAKLRKFLILRLSVLQLRKIIRLKYIKILWNCNFNSLNLKNLRNLARHKIFETPWGWHRDVETCKGEHYIKI